MTRWGVDEGRCKPQDTHDDGADGHPNVEPAIYEESARHSGCCHWSALVLHARRIPLLPRGMSALLVSEVSIRRGYLRKIGLSPTKTNLRFEAYFFIARSIRWRFFLTGWCPH